MTDLTINGETFKVEVEGEPTRPALMLSNSLGTDLSMWAGQIPALTKHFRVIRYDTRGHGGSVVDATPASMARLGADALAILDALGIGKVHWLGLSMGGAIGLWLLINAPTRIDRAILANTAPKLGSPESWNARITSVLAGGMEENAAATIERWFTADFTAHEPARVGAIHAQLRSASPQGYAACCAALRDMDLREALHGIDHEVLILTGRDDPVVPDADATALVAGIKRTKHVSLDARHMSNIEAEAAFNAAVIAFLTAKTARANTARAKPISSKGGPTKSTPRKRSGVSRRANAARNPLKKAPARKAATKAPPSRSSPGKTTPSTGRRKVAKTSATRRGAPKTATKKPLVKARPKAVPARRSTSTSAARGAVKKTKPKKTVLKASAKKTKSPAKKLPATRRRPAKTSGRPSGRRKT